ncbi:DUF4214 domain-containing protein, partial [Methylobacterium nigriterrae]|uniref:DUF4214 domain-containing protein n=1 Tax=Methylobacterium nigriterrae TaxID=3127512 RepID=UPI00301353DA
HAPANAAALLYGAAFDRAPDAAGLSHWTAALDSGTSLKTVAESFLASDEFVFHFGAASDASSFVTDLYENALHRAPEAAGLSYWTAELSTGAMDRADLLVAFSHSAENIANHTDPTSHGLLFA